MIVSFTQPESLAGKQFLVHGTLAAGPFQRTGNGLARAIEKECGLVYGSVTLANVTTTAGDVVIDGQTVATLVDGFPVTPANNDIARSLRATMQMWSEHDLATAVLFTLLMVTRFVRFKWPGLTKAQWTGLTGACWDAATSETTDGD